ncbi:hypothetical protein BCR37DRAFT_377245 [Protomyces lactucae-debilis]|uniref:Uncharacterized protein n=1 Tax=Protomyces lactucae-debilis TaxID=2754530 RepID=A0A1Y2FQT0_PROLT|nr:uncharacterized protein BCR37DRAFT_377245 [Protomyces lactucae-debilis]ORY85566.1 hypothetical protein BCR37DRAFT_377245 [Protomyces lactucae-debilis]
MARRHLTAFIALIVASLFLFTGLVHFSALPQVSWAHGSNEDAVLYVHYDGTEVGRRNLKFFVDHALHRNIDFYFIINGHETQQVFPDAPNIHIIRRDNSCYDLGTHGVVLQQDNGALMKKYKRFILTNSSIRGPFFPAWARHIKKACWTEVMFSALKNNVKLVGLTANCMEGNRDEQHLQSMMLATDRQGLDAMMPSLQCFGDRDDAIVNGEMALTRRLRDAGFDAMPLYSGYFAGQSPSSPQAFWDKCTHGDVFLPEEYSGGMDIHPFDTLFAKIVRADLDKEPLSPVGMASIHQLTQWADESQFSSYDQC